MLEPFDRIEGTVHVVSTNLGVEPFKKACTGLDKVFT